MDFVDFARFAEGFLNWPVQEIKEMNTMRVVPKPDKTTPLLEADGKTVSQAWDEYFSYLSSLNLPAFSKTAPTNNQVPIWNDTTKIYVPGAN